MSAPASVGVRRLLAVCIKHDQLPLHTLARLVAPFEVAQPICKRPHPLTCRCSMVRGTYVGAAAPWLVCWCQISTQDPDPSGQLSALLKMGAPPHWLLVQPSCKLQGTACLVRQLLPHRSFRHPGGGSPPPAKGHKSALPTVWRVCLPLPLVGLSVGRCQGAPPAALIVQPVALVHAAVRVGAAPRPAGQSVVTQRARSCGA